jgi:hypothetical protein
MANVEEYRKGKKIKAADYRHASTLLFFDMAIQLLWRACNLTAFTHSSTGPVAHPSASPHEGPGFNPQGDTYVKPGFS